MGHAVSEHFLTAPEVGIGWGVFVLSVAVAACLGIARRLHAGEAAAAALLGVPAGVGAAYWTVVVRAGAGYSLAIPASIIAVGGYSLMAKSIARARRSSRPQTREGAVLAAIGVLIASSSAALVGWAIAQGHAGDGPATWLVPIAAGIATFFGLGRLVYRGTPAPRTRSTVPTSTPVSILIGSISVVLMLSMSGLVAAFGFFPLAVSVPYMWLSARRAGLAGGIAIGLIAAINMGFVGIVIVGVTTHTAGMVPITGGITFFAVTLILFLARACRSVRTISRSSRRLGVPR